MANEEGCKLRGVAGALYQHDEPYMRGYISYQCEEERIMTNTKENQFILAENLLNQYESLKDKILSNLDMLDEAYIAEYSLLFPTDIQAIKIDKDGDYEGYTVNERLLAILEDGMEDKLVWDLIDDYGMDNLL